MSVGRIRDIDDLVKEAKEIIAYRKNSLGWIPVVNDDYAQGLLQNELLSISTDLRKRLQRIAESRTCKLPKEATDDNVLRLRALYWWIQKQVERAQRTHERREKKS